jgi:hypothetical protein
MFAAKLADARPFHVALAYCVVLSAIVYFAAWRMYGGNLSGFICVGDRFISRSELPSRVIQLPRSAGYDGQFFFFIAHDPLMLGDWKKHIDRPAYRYQRILYPGLAGAVTFGKAKWIPRALVLVNMVALTLAVWLLARRMVEGGRSAWCGAILGLLPGCLLGVFRDLCDPLAIALLVAAFIAYERRGMFLAPVLVAAALLARETALVAVALLGCEAVARRRWRDAALITAAVIPFAAWQGYVWLQAGEPSWRGGTGNLGAPFVAVVDYAGRLLKSGSAVDRAFFVLFAAQALACLPVALVHLWRRRDATAAAFAVFSAMPFMMSRFVWVEPWSYARVLVAGAAFLLLCHARTGGYATWVPLALNLALVPVTLWYAL